MIFHADLPTSEAEARAKLAQAIASKHEAEKTLASYEQKLSLYYERTAAEESEIIELEEAARIAQDNFARAEFGSIVIEKAPRR